MRNVLILCLFAAFVSCKGSKEDASPSADSRDTSTQIPPLEASSLAQLSDSWGVVRRDDGTFRQGILLRSGTQQNGDWEYLILTDVPKEETQIEFAVDQRITKVFSATRTAILENGLSLFKFSSNHRFETFSRHSSRPGEKIHALRLSKGTPLEPEAVNALRTELDNAQRDLRDYSQAEQRRMSDNMQSPAIRNQTTYGRFFSKISTLGAQLKFSTQTLTLLEVSAGTSSSSLAGNDSDWENTVLIGEDLKVFAIRLGDQWINIDEAFDSIPTRPKSVKLSVRGSNSSLDLTCSLRWDLPPDSKTYTFLAATTHELEMNGSGTIEERLAKIPKQSFQNNGTVCNIATTASWNGQPTTLWIKVMDEAKPEELILDEAISLDYDDAMVATWAKPPSDLIELSDQSVNSPEDLVKSQTSIAAGGVILDLIPTKDPSILLVQTDKSPFWATFDLKTGKLGKVPWPVSSDTLIAPQGDKTYLANRKTKVVEIWNNTTNKREALRLLDLTGELRSIAAPQLAPNSPVLVVTSTTASFVDCKTFKAMNCAAKLSNLFPIKGANNRSHQEMDPATMWARASADGTIYQIAGVANRTTNKSVISLVMHMHDDLVTNSEDLAINYIPTVGRNQCHEIPDQAGGNIALTVTRRGYQFPGNAGEIEIRELSENRSSNSVIRSAAFVPTLRPKSSTTSLPLDRKLYLDSSHGTLLIPQNEQIHFLQLKLPQIAARTPDFVFAGETLKLPLPRGTGHQAKSSIGGDISINGEYLNWSVPEKPSYGTVSIQLNWTGELGSPMERTVQIRPKEATIQPTAISPDGKRSIKLARRAIINASYNNYVGIAGAGNVLLLSANNQNSAWSLIDGSKLCEIECNSKQFIGDADRLYLLDHAGSLKSYDILTGKLLKSNQFGSQSKGDKQGINFISTGSASRSALITIAFDNFKKYYADIDRDTLELGIFDFGEGDVPIPTYQLTSNSSGSVCWSWTSGIFREGERVTVRAIEGAIEGTPDASGRFLVDRNELKDINQKPIKVYPRKSLPGGSENSQLSMDTSGRYLLISNYDSETNTSTISVRKLTDGFEEVFKLKTSEAGSSTFVIIPNTKTFLTTGRQSSDFMIYDLDCEAIEKEFSKGNP